MKPVLAVLTLTVALLSLVGRTQAEDKFYVWTYQTQTFRPGELETEIKSTWMIDNNTASEYQWEVEGAFTWWLSGSVYNVFSQDPGQNLKYKGFKLRANLMPVPRGRWPWDATLLLEFQRWTELNQNSLEAKIILDRYFGRWHVAINPTVELEKEPGKEEWEIKPAYALAGSYPLNKVYRLGAELQGEQDAHYLGPVLAFNQKDFWAVLGTGFRLSKAEYDAPTFQLRLLVGWGLWEGR
jgi:hypothetical protein